MASTGHITDAPQTKTVTIDSNLTDKEYFFVNMDASDDKVVNIAADASKVPFPLIEGGNGSSDAVSGTIATGGESKAKLGGTVTQGDKLTSDSNGKAVATTTDTDHYGAIALASGVLNDVIPVKVVQGMVAG